MTAVTGLTLRTILDSRGDPTVEAEVSAGDAHGRAAAPSGASTGEHEAIELPAEEAVAAEPAIAEAIAGVDVTDQRAVDDALAAVDGTDDFSGIGANAAVATSMAAAKAGADAAGEPLWRRLGGSSLPTPLGNVIGGGEHAHEATDIQEFLLAPVGAPTFADAAFVNARIHGAIGDLLVERGHACGKGDEGAWAPSIDDGEAFAVIEEAIDRVDPGFAVRVGLDVAASELYDEDEGVYAYTDAERSTEEQIAYVAELIREHDLAYVEDPLDEEDFAGFAALTDRVADTDALICGDDLFVTDPDRIDRGVEAGAANSVLIKPNQIGTVTLTAEAIDAARRGGYDAVLSHRSGETEDATIAHLAVGYETRFVKTGAVGGERTAKLNELIRIQHAMEAERMTERETTDGAEA